MLEVLLPFAVQRTLQAIAELRRSFPDYHGTNEIQVAEGDMVANRFVFYGTHQGEYMGVAPTGREVTFPGLTLDKVIDGKIVESIVEVNLEDISGQIGAVVRAEPPEGAEVAAVGAALGLLVWGAGWASWLPLAGVHRAPWTERTPKVLLPVLDHAVFGAAWGLANWAVGGRARGD